MTKTLLIGNFGAGNIGDEIILTAALEEYPDVIVMTSDPVWSQAFTGKTFKTIPMPATGVRSFVKQLIKSEGLPLQPTSIGTVSRKGDKSSKEVQRKVQYDDNAWKVDIEKIIFPGGGLFAIKPQAYWIWYRVLCWTKKTFPEAEIELQHQGVDNPENRVITGILRKSLKLVDTITVRDKGSKEAVEKNSLHIAKVVGDRGALWLQSSLRGGTTCPYESISSRMAFHTNALGVKKSRETSTKRRVLINALDGFDLEYIKKQFPGSEYIFVGCEEKDMGSVWKPGMKAIHTKVFDPQKEWKPKDSLVAVYPQTLDEVIELFGHGSICVGQRLHFLILGEVFCGANNTYVLEKPYSEKVASLVKEKGLTILEKEESGS